MSKPDSWHQQQAVKRYLKTKEDKAHVYESTTSVTSLCGLKNPTVTVGMLHALSPLPENNVCKKCTKAANKLHP